MIALWILGILALLVAVILLLRAGVQISFGRELHIAAKVGPVRLTILPKEKKTEKPKKEKKKKAEGKKEPGAKKDKKKGKFTFEDVKSVAPVLFGALKNALGKTRRSMRVDPLRISICFGDEDPSRVAQIYGWANTAMWTAMPQLERLIHIPDPHIHMEVDYNSFSTRAEGEVGICFRVGDLLGIALALAFPMLKWYLAWQKERKKVEAQKDAATDKVTKANS